MADEPQVPAQPEGAGQQTKKKPTPVNLAMVEAAERGLDLAATPPPKEKSKAPAAAAPPPPPAPAPAPQVAAPEPAALSASAEAAKAEGVPDPAAGVSQGEPVQPDAAEESAGQPEGGGEESLASLAETASRKRLSPRDEDRATVLLRACIENGQVGDALAAMPKLPWILGVRGIEQAWPQLTPEGRAQLLDQLATFQSEHAIRLRLSVARSLAKIDPPVGVQLAGAVCRAIWNAENGSLSSEHSKLIGNVFIGRGKPWVIQLPLESLPPEDAQAIASAVLYSAFNVNNPPITQLSILRYAGPLLNELHPNLLAMVAKGISRWSGKWQDSLRKEVPNLPEAIASTLKPGRPGKPDAPARGGSGDSAEAEAAGEEETELPLPPDLEEKLKLAIESGDAESVEAVTMEVNAWRDAHAANRAEEAESSRQPSDVQAPEPPRGEKKRRGRDRDRGERGDRGDRSLERKERPAYISREQEAAAKAGGAFNLSAVLKQIESQFAQLRSELGNTQAKLRKAESASPRRTADKVMLSVEEANLSTDELKRLVLQLERRNGELQARVEELLADSETRALATASDADVTAQFRTLLKLKLQEDYSDYLALEKNLPEFVVQQHYRAVIRHVFGVLREEGVSLEGDLPPPPPEPLPPPPPPPVIDDEEDEEESALDQLDAEPDAEPAEADAPEANGAEENDVEESGAEENSAEETSESPADEDPLSEEAEPPQDNSESEPPPPGEDPPQK